eukprot:TRINITY_DN3584_c0_g1_i6.p2 TRINITY_DN3584_c0_g1~~TRINITY_DN3584_c0_g1_i6.p2  ORF type:complete len:295 (+),score=16.66 TRINITY_DN3584_c0_g1_i6:27-911(+)
MRALRVLLSRSFSFFNSNLIKRIYTYVIQLKFTMSFTSFVSLLLVSFAYGQLSLPPTFLPPFSASTNFFPSSTSPPASGLSQFGSFPSFGFSSPPAQTPQELFSNFPRTFSDIFGTGSVFGNFGSSSPLPSLSPIVSDLQAQFNEEVIRAEVEISFPDVDCDTGKSMEFQKTIKAALNVEAGCPAGQDCAEILEVTCGSLKIKIALLIFVNRASTQIDTEASSDEISVGGWQTLLRSHPSPPIKDIWRKVRTLLSTWMPSMKSLTCDQYMFLDRIFLAIQAFLQIYGFTRYFTA